MDAMIDKVSNAKTDQLPKYRCIFERSKGETYLILFHNSSPEFVEKYNAAGQIKDYNQDYFHLNNSNFRVQR